MCDLPTCRSPSKSDIKRLACFHTLHQTCIPSTGVCPICQLPLEKKVEELSQTFMSTCNESGHNIQIAQLPTLNLCIPATIHQNFTTWHFPQRLSQSTIGGCIGSNGCTLIALTIAKLFYTFPPHSINPSLQLNQTLAYKTVSGMVIGNQNHDRITMGVPQMFGVREAVSHLNFLGNISVGSELPVSISKEPVPSASLPYHLELAFHKPKTACFLY